MRLGRDRPVRHRPGRKALHDRLDGLDLFERDRRAHGRVADAQSQQAAEGRQSFGLVVDEAAVLPEDVEALGTCRVLQLEDRLWVEQVVLAVAAPLVLAADLDLELAGAGLRPFVGVAMAPGHLLGQLGEADRRPAGSASTRSTGPRARGRARSPRRPGPRCRRRPSRSPSSTSPSRRPCSRLSGSGGRPRVRKPRPTGRRAPSRRPTRARGTGSPPPRHSRSAGRSGAPPARRRSR